MTTPTLADHWAALSTTALLGTDRRPAPSPPSGPLAELVADVHPLDDGESVLVQVAALTSARRAGLRPAGAPTLLAPCPHDQRPLCPPAATRRLPELLSVWPELVDEWLMCLVASGYRLPGEHVVTLLARHRYDPARRPLVEAAAGPVAPWLAELFPARFAGRRTRSRAQRDGGATSPATLADADAFPLPSDLALLVGAPIDVVIDALVDGLTRGALANRHRPVLVHLIRRLPLATLEPLADALSRAGTNPSTLGLTMSLADLARTRATMIAELAPDADRASPAERGSPNDNESANA